MFYATHPPAEGLADGRHSGSIPPRTVSVLRLSSSADWCVCVCGVCVCVCGVCVCVGGVCVCGVVDGVVVVVAGQRSR